MQSARIALFQMEMSITHDDALKKCLQAIKEASKGGADLILFPELTLSRFFPQYIDFIARDKSVSEHNDDIMAFQSACKNYCIYAVPNFYLEENSKLYDASVLISPQGKISGIQKMVHIAQAEHFYEQNYYTPSNDGFHVFDTDFGRIGIIICFDRHYPESIRTESLKGANLILVPTANIVSEPLEMFEWEIRVQAFQNCVPIVMCNRVGTEDKMCFSGESLAVDANGNLLKKADKNEQLLFINVDMQQAEKVKALRPYLSLRRTEFYL